MDRRKDKFEGLYYQTRKAKLYTRPNEAVLLYISTMAPGSAHFAGKYGDGLISVGGNKPEVYQEIMANFEAGAREAGKDPATMPRLIELNVAYTDDKEAAIANVKKYWAGTFIPALFDQKIYTPEDSARNGEAVGTDTIQQKMCISSNSDEHVKFAQMFVDLGFTQLYFHSPGPDQKGFITGYGRDVLPRMRKLQSRIERQLPPGESKAA